ncbi:MAG: class I SAM-dependent methyltransferase, partial [Gemmatimonadaceae bacterium]|nr:class I SAM-dependent methyltransferase [Chitinophagaceae bacterium]
NFIYKGPILEWYMRVKLRLENNYVFFHNLVPRSGKILDLGCGYGFMPYMLHFAANGRDITGVDYDEQKIATANHSFSKNEHIRFIHSDLLSFDFETYDCIIMSDVLHYLQEDEQKKVVEKCIDSLHTGGILIIRDGNKDLEKRHKGTKLTELFSTRIFAFNKTSGKGLNFISASLIKGIASEKNVECVEMDNTKFTSNVVFIIKKG